MTFNSTRPYICQYCGESHGLKLKNTINGGFTAFHKCYDCLINKGSFSFVPNLIMDDFEKKENTGMIWIMTRQEELINLAHAKRIYVSMLNDTCFIVEALMTDGDEHDLREFNNEDDAKDYLNFLYKRLSL